MIDLLGAFVRNVDYLFVGRWLGAATLGIYTLAFRIPDLVVRDLCLTLSQVLLPVYARVRQDPAAIRATFLAAASYVTALTAPMALGLALVAEPLVLTAFGERWREVAAVLPSICVYALLISLTYNLGDLYKALGRPDVLTRLSLLRAGDRGSRDRVRRGGRRKRCRGGLGTGRRRRGRRGREPPLRAADSSVSRWDRCSRSMLPIGGACAFMAVVVLALRSFVDESAAVAQLLVCVAAGASAYALALRLVAREFWDQGLRVLLEATSRRRVVGWGHAVTIRLAYLLPHAPEALRDLHHRRDRGARAAGSGDRAVCAVAGSRARARNRTATIGDRRERAERGRRAAVLAGPRAEANARDLVGRAESALRLTEALRARGARDREPQRCSPSACGAAESCTCTRTSRPTLRSRPG